MTFEELRYFTEAAQSGSFSAAAEGLHITPQGLSQGIRHLEQELAVRLFVRGSSGVSLSPFGRMIYPEVKQILDSFDRIHTLAVKHSEENMNTIRFTYKRSRIGFTLKQYLQEYQQRDQDICIDFIEYSSREERDKLLASGGCECLLEYDQAMQNMEDRFACVPLFASFVLPVMCADNPLAEQGELSWEALNGVTIIAESENPIYMPLLRERLKRYGVECKLLYRFDALYCMEALNQSAESVFFTTRSIYRHFRQVYPALRLCNIADPIVMNYSAYLSKKANRDKRLQTILKYIEETMRSYDTL